MKEQKDKDQQWWNSFYDDLIENMHLKRTSDKRIKEISTFLEVILKLKKGDCVLDQCCGLGRVSTELSNRGFSVYGIDLSNKYIEYSTSISLGSNVTFEVRDATTYVPPFLLDGAFNWYTSLRYFETDEKNSKMIERAYLSIKSGKHFVQDFMNSYQVINNFLPLVSGTFISSSGHKISYECKSILTNENKFLEENWVYNTQSGQTTHKAKVRLYTPTEISTLFKNVGFMNISLYGNTSAEVFSHTSQRCIIKGTK